MNKVHPPTTSDLVSALNKIIDGALPELPTAHRGEVKYNPHKGELKVYVRHGAIYTALQLRAQDFLRQLKLIYPTAVKNLIFKVSK